MALEPPPFLLNRLAASVAVLGDGVSGKAAVSLLNAIGAAAVVYDLNGKEFTEAAAKRHLLVVFSPGFVPGPSLAQAGTGRERGMPVRNGPGLSFLEWETDRHHGHQRKDDPHGIPGARPFREAGRAADVAGNIGFPFSACAKADSDGRKAQARARSAR